jgi:transposase
VLTIGVDAHSQVNVAVALDDAGRQLACWRGANTPAGWAALARWGAARGEPRRWGVEGAGGYGRGLAQYLVGARETVHEVNPRWTAEGRRRARRRGKSDELDARAAAEAVRRETDLPMLQAEDETAVLDLLVAQRDDALAEATRLRNQAHQLLHRLDPTYRRRLPTLTSKAGVAALVGFTTASALPLDQARAAAVRRLGQRLRLALEQAGELTDQIRAAAGVVAPLTEICGVNLLTAAALAGILGPGRRFASDAQLAAYAGAAPLEASSGSVARHRLNRGGHRRLNAILYRVAITQARHSPEAQAYLRRRAAEGKTKREALRALKRHLVRAIGRRWQLCRLQPPGSATAAPPPRPSPSIRTPPPAGAPVKAKERPTGACLDGPPAGGSLARRGEMPSCASA